MQLCTYDPASIIHARTRAHKRDQRSLPPRHEVARTLTGHWLAVDTARPRPCGHVWLRLHGLMLSEVRVIGRQQQVAAAVHARCNPRGPCRIASRRPEVWLGEVVTHSGRVQSQLSLQAHL